MTLEGDVGIEQYANSCTGFTGILRHRFTDFKVNEIDPHGNVVKLTDLKPPPEAPAPEEPAAGGSAPAPPPPESVDAVVEACAAITGLTAPHETLTSLQQFLEQAAARKEDRSAPVPAPVLLPPIQDKAQRTAAHQLFKGLTWLPPVSTTTVASAGADGSLQCIRVSLQSGGGRGGNGGDQRGQKRKRDWAGGSKRFLHFSLYKENMDTHNAMSLLANMLHCKPKVFAVAGTKDKRAVTVQRVSGFRVDPARLAGATARARGLRVGNFAFADEALRLGDLRGNAFDITLRGISAASADAVAAAAEGLRASGFINYYGLQRFGASDVPTHHVGLALLKGQWEQAIRLIIAPGRDTAPEVVTACNAYLNDGNAAKALAGMPRYFLAATAILQELVKEGRDLVNALVAVPRNLRTMYIHAYQSYLWNAAASARVAQFGATAVVAGDLVLPRAKEGAQQAQQDTALDTAAEGSGDGLEAAADGGDAVEAEIAAGAVEVHVVSEEEAAAGVYRIEDVVLPLVGNSSVYPTNSVGDVFRSLAARDGVPLDAGSTHSVREFSLVHLPGAYRRLVYRPTDLQYEVLRYNDADADLALTGLQELEGCVPLTMPPDGKFLALRLSFSLPSSCYATMLIRELTKMPTHVAFAKSLEHPK